MIEYRVEVKNDSSNWNDYGSTHFHVYARNDREAYEKACEIEYASNIKKIVAVKYIG